VNAAPDAEEIYNEVTQMNEKWDDENLSLMERTGIKDRLRYLNGRCQWISNATRRAYVQEPIDALWQKVLHSA
jgi:MoxR-like ATPase